MLRNVDIIVGGQWGSEGKGNIVSAIAHQYDVMVRTGGPNAGHSVMFEGQKHIFRHLPSGALHSPNAKLILGAGSSINVQVLRDEMRDNRIDPGRVIVHPRAVIIDHEMLESDHSLWRNSIGGTGQGVGMAAFQKILRDPTQCKLAGDARLAADLGVNVGVANLLEPYKRILVEGSQGVMLSLHHGQWPYVTSRDTTPAGLLAEAGIPPLRVAQVIVCFRTFPIRVANPENGTSGPMGDEITWAEVAAQTGQSLAELEAREHTTTTKKLRRVAKFNIAQFVQACMLSGPTKLALTFADYLQKDAVDGLIRAMQDSSDGVPVSYVSTGFGPEHVRTR